MDRERKSVDSESSEPAPDELATSAGPGRDDETHPRRAISEDWAATIVGLGLLLLALLGVIGKGVIP
jgi:hypothetical protein